VVVIVAIVAIVMIVVVVVVVVVLVVVGMSPRRTNPAEVIFLRVPVGTW
jgi:hypothetical protein